MGGRGCPAGGALLPGAAGARRGACALRTPLQRDRDRIVHCKAFRRLKHKTQVFVAPEGDHYRTRLTHTIEVTQISRTVARALRLNEDLVEAIGLGHDLGHTPFGHIGEAALDALPARALRARVPPLRALGAGGAGARGPEPRPRTWSTASSAIRAARRCRGRSRGGSCGSSTGWPTSTTTSTTRSAPACSTRRRCRSTPIAALGDTGSQRIDTLVHDLVEHSAAAGDIVQGDEAGEAMDALRTFMFDRRLPRATTRGASRRRSTP